MNSAHLHLVLTHAPVLGILFGLCLLLLPALRPSEEVKRAALVTFVVAGLLAIPAYTTGEPAAGHLKRLFAGARLDAMDQHSEIAVIGLTGSLVLAAISTVALVRFRRGTRIAHGMFLTVVVIAALCAGLMGWTANLGGKIRHTETTDLPP